MKLALASAAVLLSAATAAAAGSTHGGGLRASIKKESKSTTSSSSRRELMEGMDNFMPLPCNANLTVDNCDGTTVLSSIIAAATLEAEALMNATNATSYPQGMEATIPCGTCAIADLSGGSTLIAHTGIDVQGMLYFPPSTHGTLETAHMFVQGMLKIDPPDNPEANRVTIKLIGPDEDVFLAPHPHNTMACSSYANGKCPVGKRPIAVAGGRLDVRGLEDPTCPSWVNLQDIWEEPLTDTQRLQTNNIAVDGDENGNGDVKCLNGDVCTLEMTVDEPGVEACLRVTTGGTKYDDGYLDVFVNTGDGSGYVEVTQSGVKHDQNSVVVEKCYSGLVGVQVMNSDANAWAGSIETSVDGGVSYTPMVCKDKCVPFGGSRATLKIGEEAANCWKATMGDVMLTNSNPNIKQEDNQKILTLASVDVAEGTVTVNLSKSQIGDPFTVKSETMMAAEVASLNRPVKFTSVKDNSGAHGGHLIIYHTPNVAQMLEGVEVRAFGQSGILGRYPIHFHHSHNVDGSVIRKNVVRDSEQRCIVVHGTNFVMVENNVAYDTRGHCFIAAEDGYETDNTFKDNLGARTKRGVNLLPGSSNDLMCSTFWITNPNNYFIGNVAAGSVLSGFWFEEPKQDPIYSFRDNVAHNNIKAGINLYPHGYSPPSPAYFDNLTLYNNGKGMFMKRTKNIRIRNSFFAWNSVGLQYFKNNGYAIIQNTTFHATPPGHADTICPTSTGIDFAYETSGKQLRIKDSSFVGYNNPNCDTVGLALRLVNLQSSSSTSGTLPRLDQVAFDPPGKNSTFGITPDSFFDSRIIILEDSDGSMTGEQGFFVNNAAVGPFSLDVCTSTEGRRPNTMFCAGSCLHTVSIEARELIGGSTKLRVTSRSDSNKTHQFEASGSTSDPAYNVKFFLDLTPSDEYDVSFVHAQTGETVFLSATVTLGDAKGYCEVDDQLVEGSFILPTPLPDSFDLFPHTNATDLAAQSGLATNGESLYDFDSGDWVTYTGIWFGAVGDTARIRLQFAAFNDGGKIEARLGGVDGEIIGYFYPWNTYGEYKDAAFDIDTDVQGLQQLTFKSTSSSDVMNFTWFELAPECESTGFICLDNSDCCSNNCGSTGFCESPPPSTYFVGYEHRGCNGRNELGTVTKPTVEDCAVACDELPTCMSFEYRMTTTSCQLSSSCSYSLTVPSSDWNFYVKVPDGVAANGNPEGNYYLWLLENAAEISPVELVEASSLQLSMASYYIGYHNGGCVGRNELGLTTQTSVEDCASACDAETTCVSFEYKKGSSTTCQLSSSCDHYSMKGNDPNSDYTWYLNIPDGYTTHTIQGGRAYMWLINVLAPSNMPSVAHSSSPSASPSVINGGGGTEFTTYYMGYNTGGCAGRNELGITNKPVVEECAAACDALSTCVSFEYKRSSTVCQLSSTCDRFDLTVNEVGSSYHWYLKVNDEVAISENPTPHAYLWLLDNLNGREVTSPAGVTSTNYYIGYNTGGCAGRNELDITTKPVVEECAAECDKISTCVSFEYKRESTNCHLSSTCNDFSMTANEVGNSYMWYERANSYTGHATTGGNAYLWLMETPTSSPTKSPVTLEPTSIEPTCLRIITGGVRYDDGYLDVFVNTGDGNGYVGVTQSGVKYALNSVVVEKCYSGLVGLQVMNSDANAWAGSIETSVDGGVSYTPMVCKDNCTPVGDSTASIVVDGDGNGDRAVKCLNGDTCTLVNSASWDSIA